MEDELKLLFKSAGWELACGFLARRRRALVESLVGLDPQASARFAELQGRVREIDYVTGSLADEAVRWAAGIDD